MHTEANIFNNIYITTNFQQLAYFNFQNFDLQEVIFFQFLVVYCQSGEYFHSESQIRSELGIRKDKLKMIVERFQDYGVLDKSVRKDPFTRTYYELNYREIVGRDFIYEIYNSNADYETLEEAYSQLAAVQASRLALLKEKQKGDILNTKPSIDKEIQRLQCIFKERREAHNKENNDIRKLRLVTIVPTRSNKLQLIKAIEKYDFCTIEKAFVAYCDYVNDHATGKPRFQTKEKPNSFLSYFLMNSGGEFTMIDRFLNTYITDYSYEDS